MNEQLKDNYDDERIAARFERALEIGLKDTFPASDPVAVLQPGPPDYDEQAPE
jgi:hypothetical protein